MNNLSGKNNIKLNNQSNEKEINKYINLLTPSDDDIDFLLGNLTHGFSISHPDAANVLDETVSEKVKKDTLDRLKKHAESLIKALSPRGPIEAILIQNILLAQSWMQYFFLKGAQYEKFGSNEAKGFAIKMFSQAQKFMNLYTRQVEMLDKHRAFGLAKTQAVNVNSGAQAVIGNVTLNTKYEN